MKTKRTLYSIVVFVFVFWISFLTDLHPDLYQTAYKSDNEGAFVKSDNAGEQAASDTALSDGALSDTTLDKVGIQAFSDQYGNVASNSNRLYQYKERYTDSEAEQNTNGTDGSRMYVPAKESILSDSAVDEAILQEPEPEPSLYSDIGISIANSYVNIRAKATADSEVKGKLHRNSAARILDSVGEWHYVESGSVKGYVNTKYIKTGIPDEELIENYGILRISVNTDGLNVREKPDIDAEKLTVIYQNECYPVLDISDEWLKVDITDDKIIGYVNREYTELLVDFEKAVSREEEEELKKLQAEEKRKSETDVKYRDEVDYTQDELKLLACLVHAEAGDQSYEGKLAVANVVLNRVKSGKYPDTIKDVIYQPGQFTVAKSGSLAKQLAKYDNYSSKSHQLTIKAAKSALSGANNIGSRLYFNMYKAAAKKGYDQLKTSVKIEDHLFW